MTKSSKYRACVSIQDQKGKCTHFYIDEPGSYKVVLNEKNGAQGGKVLGSLEVEKEIIVNPYYKI